MNRRQFFALSAAVPLAGVTATLAIAEFIPVGYYRWYDYGTKTMFWSFYGDNGTWQTYRFKDCVFGVYRFVTSTYPDVRTACAYARSRGELYDESTWPPFPAGRTVGMSNAVIPIVYGSKDA